MNKAGETRSYSAGDKLPESTGDKLQDLLGIWIPLSWGNFSDYTGERFYWGVWYSAGEQSYIKTTGDACLGTSVYSAGEY